MTQLNANLSLNQNSISIHRFDKLSSSILKLVKTTRWYRAEFRLRPTEAVHTKEKSGVDPLKRDLDRIILAVDTEVTGVYHRSDKK